MIPEATVDGQGVGLAAAIAAAASLLQKSRRPLVAGLDTDIAGAEAAIALARRIGGAVDHAHAAAALRDIEVMRSAGWVVTTPLQARARADVLLLVGLEGDPAWLNFSGPPPLQPAELRRVLRLKPEGLLDLLGSVRAKLAGRPVAGTVDGAAELIEALPRARYGVVAWQTGGLDVLTLEMLCGLIDDLNASTRYAGLPLPPPGNAAGVMQAATWLTGFPLPLDFAGPGGPAAHDPWRFDARRLVESGEADAVLWLSAGAPEPPPWTRTLPTVALTASGTRFAAAPDVAITVGRPGQDHDAVLFDPALGSLAARTASAPSDTVRAADLLARIAEKIAC